MTDSTSPDSGTGLVHERTSLAGFRRSLALDRATLAWIRTALTMGGFGFGMIGIFRTLEERAQTPEAALLDHEAVCIGELLVLMGIVATVYGVAAHWNSLRRMEHGGLPQASRWLLRVTIVLMVALLGAVGLWRLVASS